MRTTIIAILLIVLTSLITGCKAASDQDVSWIFETPTNPVDVAVELDTERTVEALIPLEGGSISATGADGTLYTLKIPADALLNETTIGLTPVTSIAGMPFGGEPTYAVQLSPEGLFLYNFATLTITPAEDFPLDEQIVFGYLEDGLDLILAPPVVDSNEIKILVQHFSGNGVTKGFLADIEPERQRLGGTTERILENAISIELALTRQGAVGKARRDLFAKLLRQYEEEVVKPRVAAAGESCANGELAIETVLRLDGIRQLLGLSEGSQGIDHLIRLFEKYPGLLDAATWACVVEEYELCVEQHIIHRMKQVLVVVKARYFLLGLADNAVVELAEGFTEQCLTFKLEFESEATFSYLGDGYESRVTSEITLRFNPDDFTISGEAPAPLVNEHVEWFITGCDVTSVTGDGTFEVFNLEILKAPGEEELSQGILGKPEELGQVGDLTLYYTPGPTSESYSARCGDDSFSVPPHPLWTAAFITTRLDEVDASSPYGGRFISFDWEIFGNQYFARKEWVTEYDVIEEVGTFKLYHTPGE